MMTTKTIISVNKQFPCLHCGKTDWCYTINEHLSACKRSAPPATGWYQTSKKDKEGTPYYAKIERQAKEIRTKQRREWEYPDRNGNKLVRVVRIDDGDGNKKIWQEHWNGKTWVKGLGKIKREDIPIYRYQEIMEAIAAGQTIFVVEGEPIVDLLWSLGFPATTNLGGSKKWKPSDSKDLASAKIIICPDRDVPGIEHALRIYQDFPFAQWLYPYPESAVWNNLPPSEGLDLVDWLNDFQLSAQDLIEAVEPTFRSQIVKTKQKPESELLKLIRQLIEKDFIGSQLIVELMKISEEMGKSFNEVKKLYDLKQRELDFEEERLERQKEVHQLLKIEHYPFELESFLPPDLAEPLIKKAEIIGSTPLALLTTLLPVVASLIHPDTRLELIRATDFYAKPIFFAGIVAESGSGKSPTQDLFINPLNQLQARADYRYKQEMLDYEAEVKAGGNPTKPLPTEYYVTDTTAEAISMVISQQPNKGFLIYHDELSGLLASTNAYRGGRGADIEKILSGRDGRGIKVNRASGKRLSNPRSTYSIVGSMTRDVLKKQMGNDQDSRGYWARFTWAILPILQAQFPDQAPNLDLNPMLVSLYENLEKLPPLTYQMTAKARQQYKEWFELLEERKMKEPSQALRAVYAKMKRTTGELALLLKSIWTAFFNQTPTGELEEEYMYLAIKLSQIYLGQVKLIRSESSDDFGDLSPVYSKLIQLSLRQDNWLSASTAKQSNRFFKAMSPEQIRSHFQELTNLGYGELKGEGRNLMWKMDPTRQNLENLLTKTPNFPVTSTQLPVTSEEKTTIAQPQLITQYSFQSNLSNLSNLDPTQDASPPSPQGLDTPKESVYFASNDVYSPSNSSQVNQAQTLAQTPETLSNEQERLIAHLTTELDSSQLKIDKVDEKIDEVRQAIDKNRQKIDSPQNLSNACENKPVASSTPTKIDKIDDSLLIKSEENSSTLINEVYLEQQRAWYKNQKAVLTHSDPKLNGKRVVIEFVQNAVTVLVKLVDDLTQSMEVSLFQLKPLN